MNLVRSILIVGLTFGLAACDSSGPGENPAASRSANEPSRDDQPCELVMGWDPWEPYQYEIAGGHVFGLDVDLITAVTRNAGCDIAFAKGNWRELLQQLRQGDIDVLAGATQTAQRMEFAYFTEPYRNEEFYLYVAANRLQDLQGKTLEELLDEGFKIGVTEGYIYGDPITSIQDNPSYAGLFSYATMAETNMARLLDGEVDGIIEDKFVGASVIRHKNLNEYIVAHPMRFNSSAVSIMVSRASVDQDLFAKIDQSVADLKASGAIDKVLAQYRIP